LAQAWLAPGYCQGVRRRAASHPYLQCRSAEHPKPSGLRHQTEKGFSLPGMSSGPVTLSIVPGSPIDGNTDDVPVLVSVQTPEGDQRTPSDICCVIDISWSMSMEATVQAAGGKAESNGLSMLDVAKHAVRTVIHTLGPEDRLAIVQFARISQTVFPLTAMNEAGKVAAEAKLDAIGFGNGTALWQGIMHALNALNAGASETRLGHIMLLTDGETEDKATVMANLQAYKRKNTRLPGTISCFGFGYEIDSQLLVEIADFSDGTYAFIPDAGFVGTIFVNSMSNLLVTMARDARLTLQAQEEAAITEVLGWGTATDAEGKLSVNLGTLQCGQARDVVLRMSATALKKCYLAASLEYSTLGGDHSATARGTLPGPPKGADTVEPHLCRSRFVCGLAKAAEAARSGTKEAVQAGKDIIASVGSQVAASPVAADEQVAALLEDVLGQSTEALSCVDYWQKWGRHYTPSVMFAHKLEQCNNFKDPGVQSYGGKLFNSLRDIADSAFDELPAPKVTPAMYRYMGNGQIIRNPANAAATAAAAAAAAPAPRTNMAAYNDRYAGCIDGASLAHLASGELRLVSELAKGDRVVAADGAVADVVCAVRTRCEGGRAALVELPGGARLTPYHPVCVDGTWRFPADLAKVKELPCEAVYSFVLRGAPALLVGGLLCVGLGHGLQEGAAEHPYFGSRRVLEDLAASRGFELGHVDLAPGCALRDPETGLVCGLRMEQNENGMDA